MGGWGTSVDLGDDVDTASQSSATDSRRTRPLVGRPTSKAFCARSAVESQRFQGWPEACRGLVGVKYLGPGSQKGKGAGNGRPTTAPSHRPNGRTAGRDGRGAPSVRLVCGLWPCIYLITHKLRARSMDTRVVLPAAWTRFDLIGFIFDNEILIPSA